MLTCPPQGRALLIVGVEVLGKGVGLQQTVEQLEEVCRGHVHVHALIWSHISLSIQLSQSVPLARRQFTEAALAASNSCFRLCIVREKLSETPPKDSYMSQVP